LYCSYFGAALALIFQIRFAGFGNWIAILKARYLLGVTQGQRNCDPAGSFSFSWLRGRA
jgi:hypothetical protein